jgi:hypothetical protein
MKPSSSARTALLLAGFWLAAANASALTAPDQPQAESKAAPAAKGEIEKGMSGDQIVALIGKPATIEKLKDADAKAEKWIYRRAVNHRVEEQATTVANEGAFIGTAGGNNNTLGTRPVIQYGLKHIDTYRVTALLMVNGKLQMARQWNEQRVSYEQ